MYTDRALGLVLIAFILCVDEIDSDGFVDLQAAFKDLVERVNALETENTVLKMQIEQLKKNRECVTTRQELRQAEPQKRTNNKRKILPEKRVAFSVTITAKNQSHLGIGQNIVFDHNITNIGNAYHPSHGIFIAPHDGVYVFFTTIVGHRADDEGTSYASFNIKGSTVARLQGRNLEQASQMIVVSLKCNDEVSVQSDQVDSSITGASFASFSGFLLYSLDKPVCIVG